ncbi:hypothetical protein NP233_g3369 [Leucocoprinus birnbaumii]|uniref:Reverse transcriptase domain-containing protein n=1 Tax=Leucocoprinus birnbaumii TaxID=56174 RepID=A0AAD5YSW3_9AGAR|nr:hypothetical protein NP233_g3369 [Leucocoprinus birnbaumii]
MTEELAAHVAVCDVDATWRPPCTDHYPVTTLIDLPLAKIVPKPVRNFRMVEWKEFRKELEGRMEELREPGEIETVEELEEQVERLTGIIQETIEKVVPETKACPHMKRWWNKELEGMKKKLNQLNRKSYRWKSTPDHPLFQEYRQLRNMYADAITQAKRTHWEDYLEQATEAEMWTANRYATEPVGDGGSPRIPTLSTKGPDGTTRQHITNEEKAEALGQAFFPRRPEQSTVPPNQHYPEPLQLRSEINEEQVLSNIKALSSFKAPGPDGIPNVVLKETAEIIAPYLVWIYRAILDLEHQFSGWKTFTTVVLRKPGKPSYEVPKAYRPIALLCTLGKVLTAIVTEELSCLLESNNLLPEKHIWRATMQDDH